MSSAQEEALNFIRKQSGLIAKDLTKEHRRFVASYKYLKDSTEESMQRLSLLEKEPLRVSSRTRKRSRPPGNGRICDPFNAASWR